MFRALSAKLLKNGYPTVLAFGLGVFWEKNFVFG